MKKHLVCSFFFTLVLLHGFAQQFCTVTVSPLASQSISGVSIDGIVGRKGNYVYSVCRSEGALSSGDMQLQRFDMSGKLDFTKKFKGEFGGKEIDYKSVFFLKGKLLLVGTARIKKEKKVVVTGEWLDDAGEKSGQPTAIDECPEKSAYDCKVFLKLSDDKKDLVIFYYNYNNKPNYLVKIAVCDDSFKKLGECDLGAVSPDREISEYHVKYGFDKSGNINAIYRYTKKKSEKRYFQDAYGYKALRYNINEKQLKECLVEPTGDRKITEIDFVCNVQGQMIATGFTSNYQSDNAGAIFVQAMDFKASAPLSFKEIIFPSSLLTKFKSSQKGDKGSELDNFKLMNIGMLDNGSLILSSQYVITNYFGEKRTQYEYDDILVFCVMPGSGEFKWISHIPLRNQKYNAKYGCMSAFYCSKNEVYLAFNDNKTAGKEAGGKDNVSMAAKIDEKGAITRQQLFDYSTGGMLNPFHFFITSEKEVLIHQLDIDGSKTGFAILTLK